MLTPAPRRAFLCGRLCVPSMTLKLQEQENEKQPRKKREKEKEGGLLPAADWTAANVVRDSASSSHSVLVALLILC